MPPSDRAIRIAAALIVAAGVAACNVAIFSEQLGLGAAAAQGTFGWKRISLLVAGAITLAVGALLMARPQVVSRVIAWEPMEPVDRNLRIAGSLIVLVGIAACGLAILAEELGLGGEAARGMFGWKQISLLVAGAITLAVGALLMARPRVVSRRIKLPERGKRDRRPLEAPQIGREEPDKRERGPIPRVVWLITAVFGALLLLYSVLLPSYRAPDEPQHLDLILYVQDTYGYPRADEKFISQSIAQSLAVARFGERDLAAAAAPRRGLRPPLDDLSPDPGRPNQLAPHPPLYYYLLALASDAVDLVTPGDAFSRPFDQTVWVLRFLNLILLLPLPVIAYSLARVLRAPQEAATAAAILPLGIPQLTHIGSALNNDNLLTLLLALLTLLLVTVARGGLSTRTAIAVGVLSGLAMLTKGWALFVPAWAALAYGVAGARTGRWMRAGALFGTTAGLGFAVAGWWWLRNQLMYERLQPDAPPYLPAAPADFTLDPLWWSGTFIAGMLESYWGLFGWLEVRLSLWALMLGTLVLVGGVVLAFLSRLDRRSWAEALLLFLSVVAIGILAKYVTDLPLWAIVLGSIVLVGGTAVALGTVALVGGVAFAWSSRCEPRSKAETLLVALAIVAIGILGIYAADLPRWVIAPWSVILVGGVALAFLSRSRDWSRAELLLAVLPTVALGVLAMRVAWDGYVGSGLTPGIQGRYLFPGVVGLAALATVGFARLLGGLGRLLPAATLALVATIQTAGILTVLHFYWAPEDTGPVFGEVRSMVAWSPWPGELIIVPAAIGLLLVAWLVREVAGVAIRGSRS